MKTSRAFTLIELLIVIAIIGILMGLLFPAVNGVINTAKKTQAKNDAVQIANAIKAFETEYGKLPSDTPTGSVSGNLLGALVNSNATLNPRGIVFIETAAYKKGKGGVEGGTWKDPWGNDFVVSLDTDYDNKIQVSTNGGTSGSTTIVKRAAVWNANTNSKQQARSWD